MLIKGQKLLTNRNCLNFLMFLQGAYDRVCVHRGSVLWLTGNIIAHYGTSFEPVETVLSEVAWMREWEWEYSGCHSGLRLVRKNHWAMMSLPRHLIGLERWSDVFMWPLVLDLIVQRLGHDHCMTKGMNIPSSSSSIKQQRQRQCHQCKSMVTLPLTLLIGPRSIPKRHGKRQNFKAAAWRLTLDA